MGGARDKSSSSSVSGSAQAWAQPFARGGAEQINQVFNANQPRVQALADLTTQGVVPATAMKFAGSLGNVGRSNAFTGDVLSGKFMNGNPHLDSMSERIKRSVADRVNSQFSMAGRYGSDAHGEGLGRGLADAELGMRYQNYADEMNRMAQQAAAAQGTSAQDFQQLMGGIGAGAELPFVGSNNLANSLGALFNGGTSNSTQRQGWLSPVLGAVAGAASAAPKLCDIRAKRDITHVGTDADGLDFFRFRYKEGIGEPGWFVGPMAQQVAELRPWALGPEQDGFLTIIPANL